jgi:hypothetical protein
MRADVERQAIETMDDVLAHLRNLPEQDRAIGLLVQAIESDRRRLRSYQAPKRRRPHRRIDAGILAGMIVPPPVTEFDPVAADEALSRERFLRRERVAS